MVLLDTHTLLWWSLDPEKLSSKARKNCQQMERKKGYISSISLWEIGIKIKRGSLDIGMTIERYTDLLCQLDCLEIVPVSAEIWLKNVALEWAHCDPADRTIVASALIFEVPLITCDKIIRAFIPERVIW